MTDHKAEAETLFDLGSSPREGKYWFANDSETLLAAQVQATLYLAEQQRIANLIAVATHNDEALRTFSARNTDGTDVDYEAERVKVDGWFVQIREALGLA